MAPVIDEAVVLACLEIPLETVLAWAQVARERGWPFVLNPAPAQQLPDELLALVTVLTPNQHELEVMGRSVEEPPRSGRRRGDRHPRRGRGGAATAATIRC